MKIAIYLNTLILGLITPSVSAITLHCPPQIKTNQSLDIKVKDWNAFVDDWSNVNNATKVTFYAGHPKAQASLAPDNENYKAAKLNWTFNGNDIWLACGYSYTAVQLIQKLPNQIKTCSVIYDLKSLSPTVLEIKCS
ncbi:MAG: hypothetical protein H0T84_08540 [Tatlockia sp.]|nr:hypothetical protein [Tatlockia sp.]